MKQYIRSYHAFWPAKTWMKLCVYLFYPLVIIMGLYFLNDTLGYYPVICMGFACGFVVTVEIILDYFVFGGIASKETNRLEYLKTSMRGMDLLKSSLITDAVRRFLSVAIIITGSYLAIACKQQMDYQYTSLQLLVCIFSTYLLTEAGILFTRFFINWWVNIAVIYILNSIAVTVGIFVSTWNIPIWAPVLLVLLGIGITSTGRRLILKRMEESYYDR